MYEGDEARDPMGRGWGMRMEVEGKRNQSQMRKRWRMLTLPTLSFGIER